MVAMNLKAETLSLVEKRESLEVEMNDIIAQLCFPGGPGLSGNLVDAEGFPRSDIDIPTVRAQRARLIALRNDHRDITTKIDENLQLLHSAKLTRSEPQASRTSDPSTSGYGSISETSSMVVDLVARVPFAMVDEISDASPAAEDGLQLGDQIMKFGNLVMGDALLARLASEVQSNEDVQIPVVLMRHGTLMSITLRPRQWHGRGLLGCHFRIL
ncbi:hypothetical protein AXF42_Ash014510 [Apostasia shenzhenica]|uniref:Nas2 N-terminal domain-containing protein n=1 Tax=Apostasia shenzhenica TaxID=1088818 RepID=A0A2H9ZWU2_9ASPA|nr:hypothetical protein AXF42_Ash014510 [Apostasia shenzhenica]